MFLTGFTSLCLTSFSSSCLYMAFDSISSAIDKVFLANPSANVFVFGDFNAHHKDSYLISNDLTQMVNFPTRIPDCDFPSLALLDLFLSSDTSICSTMAFHPLGNSVHVAVSVSIYFPLYSQQNALFHRMAFDYLCADGNGLPDHLIIT